MTPDDLFAVLRFLLCAARATEWLQWEAADLELQARALAGKLRRADERLTTGLGASFARPWSQYLSAYWIAWVTKQAGL